MIENHIVPDLIHALAIEGGAEPPIRRSPIVCRCFAVSALLLPDWGGSCGL
jgi:hypothetical protein